MKKYPTTSEYGEWLESEGFKHPSHKRPGIYYTNVFGFPAEVDMDKKFMLVRYRPVKSETHYETGADAIQASIGLNGDWQVLNAVTGQILREPPQKLKNMGNKDDDV